MIICYVRGIACSNKPTGSHYTTQLYACAVVENNECSFLFSFLVGGVIFAFFIGKLVAERKDRKEGETTYNIGLPNSNQGRYI